MVHLKRFIVGISVLGALTGIALLFMLYPVVGYCALASTACYGLGLLILS